MDDNKIMEAAKLIANSSAALIEAMGKEVKIDVGFKDVLEKSLSAIQYLRIHGFSTYMESEGIVNRIMMFKDKNEMRDQKIRSI